MNVLITAASRRVPLVQAFQAALRPLRGRVVVTDVNPSSPAVHVADRAYRVPYSGDPAYIDALSSICPAERIGLVVPTIDDELEAWRGARALRGGRCEGRLLAAGDRHAVQRQVRDLHAFAAHGIERPIPGCRRAAGRCAGVAVHQAARRPRQRRCLSHPEPPRARLLLRLRQPAGHSRVSSGTRVHDRRAVRRTGEALSIVPRERVVIRSGVSIAAAR